MAALDPGEDEANAGVQVQTTQPWNSGLAKLPHTLIMRGENCGFARVVGIFTERAPSNSGRGEDARSGSFG